MELNAQNRRNLERAKQMKYLKTQARRKDALENAFILWCKEMGYPCIKVSQWQKHSTIEIGLDGTDLEFTDDMINTIDKLYFHYTKNKNVIAGSAKYIFLDKIPLTRTDDFTERLLSLLPFDPIPGLTQP
jgi:hypothetical protein